MLQVFGAYMCIYFSGIAAFMPYYFPSVAKVRSGF